MTLLSLPLACSAQVATDKSAPAADDSPAETGTKGTKIEESLAPYLIGAWTCDLHLYREDYQGGGVNRPVIPSTWTFAEETYDTDITERILAGLEDGTVPMGVAASSDYVDLDLTAYRLMHDQPWHAFGSSSMLLEVCFPAGDAPCATMAVRVARETEDRAILDVTWDVWSLLDCTRLRGVD